MINTTTISLERFMGNHFKHLESRGWQLGHDFDKLNLAQRIERLLKLIYSGCPADRYATVKPLPDWLVNTLQNNSGNESLESYLNHSETWHDIFDSMVLWLDYDRFQENNPNRMQDAFLQRRSDLRENSYFNYLVTQKYLFKKENPIFIKNSELNNLSLRQRLTMVGTFCVENFGSTALRDACHGQIVSKQKTRKIPDAFLRYHEAMCANPLQTNVVLVSGYFTIFFSLHDYLTEMRRTSIASKDMAVLENSSLQEMIEYFRTKFIKGIPMDCPDCHYRHDRIKSPKFLESLAMVFWRHKLRDHMLQEERKSRNRLHVCRLPEDDQARDQPQAYHSRLVLEKIPQNAKASLEFLRQSGPATPGLACWVGGLKERLLLLAVETKETARCEAALDASLFFRFSIPAKHRDQRFYACACRLREIKPVSDTVTALLVEPTGDVIPLDRQHPRITTELLPIESAGIWLDIKGLPESLENLSEPGEPISFVFDPDTQIWLENISAGGACLVFNTDESRSMAEARYASGASPSGLLHLRLSVTAQRYYDLRLSFRMITSRQCPDALRTGIQFLSEADQSSSGKLNWRPIVENGSHEMSRIIFAALLKRRNC